MIRKWIEGTMVALALLLIAFMTFLAFSPVAHSAETCVTGNDFEQSYQENKSDEKNHYYRFTGKTLESLKEFVNKEYEAGFDDTVKAVVLAYHKGNPAGLVAIYTDETMNSCAVKIIQPRTDTIEKVIEFLEGV